MSPLVPKKNTKKKKPAAAGAAEVEAVAVEAPAALAVDAPAVAEVAEVEAVAVEAPAVAEVEAVAVAVEAPAVAEVAPAPPRRARRTSSASEHTKEQLKKVNALLQDLRAGLSR